MESLTQYYRVDRREIAFFKFIIESYDGAASLTTVEPQSGLVVLRIPPGCEGLIDDIITDLKKTILIEPAAQPS
jgi:peptidyl-tRNA hydrolase